MNSFIHLVFENVADRFPDRIAIEEDERAISYTGLDGAYRQLSGVLQGAGVAKGDTVCVLLPSGIEAVTALLAIFKAGAVYLPVDTAFTRKRFAQIFRENTCRCLITNPEGKAVLLSLMETVEVPVPDLIVAEEGGWQLYTRREDRYAAWPPAPVPPVREVALDPDDGNYIFYTSGSTGEGKAFLGCHKSLSHFIGWEIDAFGLDHTCRVSQLSQLTFDASFRDILLPLSVGGTLCIPSAPVRNNVHRLIEWIAAKHISLIHCVPSIFKLLTRELPLSESKADRFPDLRYILMAGEALYNRDVRNWRDAVGDHVQLVNLYGTSETTLAKTFHRIGAVAEDPHQVIHAGQPIANAFVIIANHNKLCRIGEIGEVYIKTPFATKGYLHDPALNQASFVANPLTGNAEDVVFRTGDLGRYVQDRNVEIVGRLDDQVKVNGKRVELNEISRAALGVAGVVEAIVLSVPNAHHE
ncbi:MAG: AMP-binding protein, partial [Cytophagales bacterium]|nr:AMP-binding protein [Cytophagales bacterium]